MEDKEDILLKEVLEQIGYDTFKDVLVKPLAPVMVKKEVTTMVPLGTKDENGIEEFDTKKEEKEMEASYKVGVILALPANCVGNLKLGDKVVYVKKFAIDFDLFRDSQLVKPYDIICKAK